MQGWKVRVLAAGLLAVAAMGNSATAQQPSITPIPLEPIQELPAGPVTAEPAAEAPAPETTTATGYEHYAAPTAGCSDCGSNDGGRSGILRKIGSYPCGDGACDKPWGCSNFCSERCFLFGSCRKFFGKRQPSTPPGVPGPVTTPCDYGTWHRW